MFFPHTDPYFSNATQMPMRADAAHISSLAYLWDSPSRIRWCLCGLVSVIRMGYDPRQNSLFEF